LGSLNWYLTYDWLTRDAVVYDQKWINIVTVKTVLRRIVEYDTTLTQYF